MFCIWSILHYGQMMVTPLMVLGYGMTETTAATSVVPLYPKAPPGAVGLLLPNMESKVFMRCIYYS